MKEKENRKGKRRKEEKNKKIKKASGEPFGLAPQSAHGPAN
jgi:hypothetical protein